MTNDNTAFHRNSAVSGGLKQGLQTTARVPKSTGETVFIRPTKLFCQ